MNLDDYRKQIDNLDAKLIEVLNQRMTICKEIGEYKKQNNIPVLNSNREAAVIEKLEPQEEYKGLVQAIWPAIMNFSKTLQ